MLDKYSVGSAINPEGELAQSIIEQADIDTSVSKLAPSNIMEDTKLVLEKEQNKCNYHQRTELCQVDKINYSIHLKMPIKN